MKQQNISTSKVWIKSYDEGVPSSLEYPKCKIWESIQNSCNLYKDYIAYEYYGTSVSYRKFMYQIEEAARGLKALGVNKGDIVTICSPNIPQAIIIFYAINMIGAVANMIHPLSAPKEIEYYINLSKSKYIFTVDVAFDKVMESVKNTSVLRIIVMAVGEMMNRLAKTVYYVSQGRKLKIDYDDERVVSWNSFLDYGYTYSGEYKVSGTDSKVAAILYSGGTTGKPKGIMLSDRNFNVVSTQTSKCVKGIEPKKAILAIMPIFHTFGLNECIHTALSNGLKCILIPQFNYKNFGRLIKQYKPNFIAGVPVLLENFIKDPLIKDLDLSFIDSIISGGDNINPILKSKIDRFLYRHNSSAKVTVGYGLTECSGATCFLPRNKQPENSIGVPAPDVVYKIEDVNTHEELPFGKEGEICISGPNVMLGYLNDKEETDKTLIKDKKGNVWLHTGDLGYIDKDGFVYFIGRLKRIIISSGYNLYPSHIESIINKHPVVEDSCVIGIPHPYKTQVAKAYVILKEGVSKDNSIKSSIKNHCAKYLAKYSMPYEIEFIDELPKTKLGKIAYKELEELNKKTN